MKRIAQWMHPNPVVSCDKYNVRFFYLALDKPTFRSRPQCRRYSSCGVSISAFLFAHNSLVLSIEISSAGKVRL